MGRERLRHVQRRVVHGAGPRRRLLADVDGGRASYRLPVRFLRNASNGSQWPSPDLSHTNFLGGSVRTAGEFRGTNARQALPSDPRFSNCGLESVRCGDFKHLGHPSSCQSGRGRGKSLTIANSSRVTEDLN